MTVQKKILDLTGSQYLVQKVKSAINDVDSSLSTHIADTDIHVTTADKATWNTVTSKANDNDVVHKSGNETVGGEKTFTGSIQFKSNVAEYGVTSGSIKFNLMDKNSVQLSKIDQGVFNNGISYITLQLYGKDSNNQTVTNSIKYQYSSNFDYSYLLPTDNGVWLGSTGNRWGKIYGIQYYYGSNNVEFSTKFVTTDTNQTISGSKTFEGVDLKLKSVAGEYTVSSGNTSLLFYDKNSLLLSLYKLGIYGSGIPYQSFNIVGYDSNNQQVNKSISFSSSYLNLSTAFLKPDTDNAIALGRSNAKWSDVQTNKVNGLTPSSLSLPVIDRTKYVDISGYFTNTGTGEFNAYPVTANGWIFLRLSSLTGCQTEIYDSSNNKLYAMSTSGSLEQIMIPVVSGVTLKTQWATGSAVTVNIARFIPCLGNI